jgi:mannitol/fructose-specific phosphotransferase system IIA component (Ntr-type)
MLCSFITPSSIKVALESSEKEESFAELLEVLVAKHPELNRKEAMNALITREEKMSTAVFPYVAVPHALCSSAGDTLVAIGISRQGIEFESPEPETNPEHPVVNVIFEILFEEKDTQTHLDVLRDILQLVSNPDFVKNVLQAKTSQEVYELIESMEM